MCVWWEGGVGISNEWGRRTGGVDDSRQVISPITGSNRKKGGQSRLEKAQVVKQFRQPPQVFVRKRIGPTERKSRFLLIRRMPYYYPHEHKQEGTTVSQTPDHYKQNKRESHWYNRYRFHPRKEVRYEMVWQSTPSPYPRPGVVGVGSMMRWMGRDPRPSRYLHRHPPHHKWCT